MPDVRLKSNTFALLRISFTLKMSIHEGFLDSNPHAVQIHGISDSSNENDSGSVVKSWDIIGIDSEGIDV